MIGTRPFPVVLKDRPFPEQTPNRSAEKCPTSNATHRLLAADFLTLSYRVVGKMMVPNTGVWG